MGARVGSDESLKGDTFGGLVVAAVRADDFQRQKLKELGVKDSKTISDPRIKVLAEKIKDLASVYFVSLPPEKYNREVGLYGLTGVMNKLHRACLDKIRKEDDMLVTDLYPGCQLEGVKAIPRAESTYEEVAAASIIARAEGLKQFQELSIRAGFTLPMGSTHVLDALVKMREKELPIDKFAKIGFRNVKDVMRTSNDSRLI